MEIELVPASAAVWPLIAELFAAGGEQRWWRCQWWNGGVIAHHHASSCAIPGK